MDKMILIFVLLFCGVLGAEDANFSKRGETPIENDDGSKDTKSQTKKKRQAKKSKSSKNKQATSKSPVATKEKTSQRKIPRFVDELYAVSNGQSPSELEYPYEKKAEMDGMFVGAIFGISSYKHTITQIIPIGATVGYKHFWERFGLRYYTHLSLVNDNINTNKSTHLRLELEADAIFNFTSNKKYSIGMFFGLGYMIENLFIINGNGVSKASPLVAIGLRSALLRNHNIELGFKWSKPNTLNTTPYVAYSYTFDL